MFFQSVSWPILLGTAIAMIGPITDIATLMGVTVVAHVWTEKNALNVSVKVVVYLQMHGSEMVIAMIWPTMKNVILTVETVVDPASIQSIAVIANVLESRLEKWLTTIIFLQMAFVRMSLIMHNATMMDSIVVKNMEKMWSIALNVIAKVFEII